MCGCAEVVAPVVVSPERGFARRTLVTTLLGTPFVAGAMPGAEQPAPADVLHDAAPPTPSRLGLQGAVLHWDPDPSLAVAKRRVEKKINKSKQPRHDQLHTHASPARGRMRSEHMGHAALDVTRGWQRHASRAMDDVCH